MPVQINELVIRANVNEGSEKKTEPNTQGPDQGQQGKEDIIKECVEIVMELLKNKTER